MKTLREYVTEASQGGYAIGHFNAPNIEIFKGIVRAAEETQMPVIIGVSEGEKAFIGAQEIAALVSVVRGRGIPVFLNADHTYSYEGVVEAIDAGFDAVVFDGAKLPIDENIAMARRCVEYARASGRDIIVEGELGYIGTSSKLLDEVPEGAQITEGALVSVDDALRFVRESGVDMLAPAIGNLHGMLKGAPNPALNIERIQEIKQATGVPLVLHGGSGVSEEDFVHSAHAGMAIIHINTELRATYRKAMELSLEINKGQLAPYRIMQPVVDAVSDLVKKRIILFSTRL